MLSQEAHLVGQTLDDRYELLELIGAGGVGEVYRARMLKLDRLVAVKLLHESLVANAAFVARFQREAKAISRMHHPQCVAVLDSGLFQSRPYLVLEYLPGQTVSRLLENGRFAPARAVAIALQVLDALSYCHEQNVIHRDLKSENLMVMGSGATRDFVKVLDFGMAKILDSQSGESFLSRQGVVPGTVTAMAPEQIQQLRPDQRIDLYATGILLYEMIVGHRPFRAKDPVDVIRMQLETPPARPREVMGESALSSELEQVILQALEKNRAQRWGSATEMAQALLHTPEGQLHPAWAATSVPEPPATVTVLDSLLASSTRALPSAPFDSPPPTSSDLKSSPTSETSPSRPTSVQRRRWLLRAGVAATGCLAAVAWVNRPPALPPSAPNSVPQTRPAPGPADPAVPAVPAASLPSAPGVSDEAAASAPAATGPAVPWIAHRDLAVIYAQRREQNDAFRAITAAVGEDPVAAGADRALLDAAVAVLAPHRVPFVLGAFRSNRHLEEALAGATATGHSRLQRHAALAALGRLRKQARADLVAMRILDIEQASTCAEMRTAFKKLRTSKDPRVGQFEDDLRTREAIARHARCLRTALGERKDNDRRF